MSSFNKLRVLFVHDGPLYRNEENQFFGLHYNNKLVDRYCFLGDSVTFMSRVSNLPSDPGQRYSLIDHPAFSVIAFPNLKSLTNRIFKKLTAEKLADEAILAHDIIIARLPSSSGSIAVKYALKHNKPLLVEFVACGWDAYWNYSWKGKLLAPYFFIKQRLRMQKVPHTIYVTEQFLQRRYPAKGKNIGVSDVELPPSDSEVLQRRIARIRGRSSTIPMIMTTVAALDVPYKGQADVIKALQQLKKSGCIIYYHLVGQGDSSRLQKLIKQLKMEDQVFMRGAMTHNQIFPFLDDVDIYIQPSKQEGLPRAVIEAMSRGCTVLGSNVGGIPELIDPQFIFRKGNIPDIVSKLMSINKQVLLDQAAVNFSASSKYSKEALELKRNKFYEDFLSDNNLRNSL